MLYRRMYSAVVMLCGASCAACGINLSDIHPRPIHSAAMKTWAQTANIIYTEAVIVSIGISVPSGLI